MFHKKLTKNEINELPLRAFKGNINIVDSKEKSKKACVSLINETTLGFDTETRPAFRKGEHYLPSVLQLAGEETVYIFQIIKTGLTPDLINILSNKKIIKCGVAINYDLIELNKVAPFIPGGFIDLGELAKKSNIPHHGLRGLTACLLNFRISKSAQTTNWETKQLTQKQITYAATDAWVGRKLYLDYFKNRTKI